MHTHTHTYAANLCWPGLNLKCLESYKHTADSLEFKTAVSCNQGLWVLLSKTEIW